MSEMRNITKEDILAKARILTEGVRIRGFDIPGFREMEKIGDVPMPQKVNADDGEEILRLYASTLAGWSKTTRQGGGVNFTFDGSGLKVMAIPNKYSRLECAVEGEAVTVYDGDETIVTGKIPERFEWLDTKLSNGLPITTALPVMSSEVINLVMSLSCINYNTGRGCRYCNLFANPLSRKIVMLPQSTLKLWAKYQGEALKIAMDNGWQGAITLSGGALPPAHRREYLDRIAIVLDTVREAVGDETFSKQRLIFNHYPPEDFSEMHQWKEYGIGATSFDLEVMDPAYFAAVCPGKHKYRPHEYWKEAQEASVDIFGPFVKTVGCVIAGIEPMSCLVEGVEERLSKGVITMPFTYTSSAGSAMWGFNPPTADWLIEATDKMTSIYLKYTPQILKASAEFNKGREKKGAPSVRSTPLAILFDEIQRRIQEISAKADDG